MENSSEKQEFAPERWTELKLEATKYFDLAVAERTPQASESLRHILGNLITILTPDCLEMAERHPEMKALVPEYIAYVKRYFSLLDEFPDFREKEESSGAGYFPELMRSIAGSKELVEEYEKRLRQSPPLGR